MADLSRVFWKGVMENVRKKTENVSKEELKKITREYDSKPWYKKIMYDEIEYRTYQCAKEILLGKFSWEEIDKKKKEKEEKKLEEKVQKEIQEENIRKGWNVDLFPGSLKEYGQFKGQKYEIIDTGEPDKTMSYDTRCGFKTIQYSTLGKLNVFGLIRFERYEQHDGIVGRGIPVKRKNS